MDLAVESALRDTIMDWVRERAEANGGFLHRHALLSFAIGGRDLPLIDFSRGIRNPAGFSSTLSILSAANGPYDDVESDDGLLHYAYRKGDPFTGDNRKLRAALEVDARQRPAVPGDEPPDAARLHRHRAVTGPATAS